MSTNEKLAALGFTTAKAGQYRKTILRDGVALFEGTAWEVECWLTGGAS